MDLPDFSMQQGELVYLAGGSGTGKSTLIHLLSGVLKADSGKVHLLGTDIQAMSEGKRDRFRGLHIGLLFQTLQLLPALTSLENVALPCGLAGKPEGHSRAQALLQGLGLGDRLHDYPNRLSTGQAQRVALARALVNQPSLILADEPTASLDAENGKNAVSLICETCRREGASLLMVSHDPRLREGFDRVLELDQINQVGREAAT